MYDIFSKNEQERRWAQLDILVHLKSFVDCTTLFVTFCKFGLELLVAYYAITTLHDNIQLYWYQSDDLVHVVYWMIPVILLVALITDISQHSRITTKILWVAIKACVIYYICLHYTGILTQVLIGAYITRDILRDISTYIYGKQKGIMKLGDACMDDIDCEDDDNEGDDDV
jgi:hypothetical protein